MNFTWRMRAAAIGWLRYDRRCYLVCWERWPWETAYRPDLIGIDKKRKVIEVEFKQSMSDFKANAAKPRLIQREAFGYAPAQFYFAVPRLMVDAAMALLPAGSGLMTVAETEGKWGPVVEILRGAQVNRKSPELSLLAITRMVRHQTGSLHRACVALARNIQ